MSPQRSRLPKVIVVVFAGFLLLAIGLIIAYSGTRNSYDPREPREPETGGQEIITLKNSEGLVKLLLPAQFDVTKETLDRFVKDNIDAEARNVVIEGEPTANDKGLVTLKFRVDENPTEYTATIDKWTHYDKIIFSVPEKSYTVTVLVYPN